MVNARFPSAQSYGFEMVHVRFAARKRPKQPSIENLRRIHSAAFLANFTPVNLNANTWIYQVTLVVDRVCPQTHTRQMRDGSKKTDDWSQDVVPAAFDVLAWAGAGAAAPGQND
jgi:hypothetical protein